MVTNATSSVAEVILQFKNGGYDVLLCDTTDAGQADAAGLIQKIDWSKVPNIKKVSANFRKAYPWGIPTDYGKVGIAYRPDIVGEKITSWKDVWRLAPKFSGRVVFINLERDCLGSTLKSLGHSANTSDAKQISAAKDAIIKIKPHLQAFLNTNVGQGLVNGSTAIAMDWDYDVALLKQKQPKIEWVAPKEGMHAYLEGFSVPKSPTTSIRSRSSSTSCSIPSSTPTSSTPPGRRSRCPAAAPLHQEVDLGEPDPEAERRRAEARRVRPLPRRQGHRSCSRRRCKR